MPGSLSIASSLDSRIFQCPNCKETINTSATHCRFCSAPIDAHEAEAAADLMAKVNQACSDASYLRIMASSMAVLWLVSFLPLIGMVGFWGARFLLFAVPVMAFRWWKKFGSLHPDDPDFPRAKRAVRISLGIWAIFLLPIAAGTALSFMR